MSKFAAELGELRRLGFVIPEGVGIIENEKLITDAIAMDAQPTLSTSPNAGIPQFMSSWVDPKLIEVAFSPMRGAELAGETKKGDWTTTTAIFPMIETTGQVSTYGDWNSNGLAGLNPDFPDRQSYHYQVIASWGERQIEMAGLARLQWVASLRTAATLKLNKFQNQSYFYGVAGLRNYGYLNDPRLPASIVPSTKAAGGTAWSNATPEEICDDVILLINELRAQTAGIIESDSNFAIGLSPSRLGLMSRPNTFGLTGMKLVKDQYPNMRFVQAMEYGDLPSQSVQTIQVMVETIDTQKVAEAAFTEKLRTHPIVQELSAWKQKMSQGTWGAIIYMPAGIATGTGY